MPYDILEAEKSPGYDVIAAENGPAVKGFAELSSQNEENIRAAELTLPVHEMLSLHGVAPFKEPDTAVGEFGDVASHQLVPWSPPDPSSNAVASAVADSLGGVAALLSPAPGRAAYNVGVKGTYDFLNTPAGVASLGLGTGPAWLKRLAALGFSTQMTKAAAEKAGEASVTHDPETAFEAAFMAAPVPFLAHPSVKFGEKLALTPGDQLRLFEQEIQSVPLGEKLLLDGVTEQSPTPMRRLAIDVNPENTVEAQAAQELRGRAMEEAASPLVVPGRVPAVELLRRQEQPIIVGPESAPLNRPGGGGAMGGRISFNAPAEAGGIPSAAQSGLLDRLADAKAEEAASLLANEGVTGPDAPSYRRPVPAPTSEQAAVRLLRSNVEKGLEGPAMHEPSTPLSIIRESQYPTEGMPSGTLSKLQRSRILAGQENVRTGQRNNPPMAPRRGAGLPPEEPGSVSIENSPKTPQGGSDLETLTKGLDFENIQRPHRVGVERGLALSAADVPALEAMKQVAYEEAHQAGDKDPRAFKAAFGKGTFLEGVIEGAKKNGPNYDFYLQEQAATSPEGAPTKSVGATDSPPAAPTTKTTAEPLPADDIIAKFQKWKYEEDAQGRIVDPQGRLFSLPHPEAIKAIGKGIWNNAIDVAVVAIKAGRAVSEAVDAAMAHIRRNAAKFDDAQLRANLNSIFSNEKIQGPKSYPVQGENVEMRKSAARATEAKSFPEPVRKTIAKAPESFYPQQSTKEVSKLVGSMPDSELGNVPKNSDLYIAAALERAKRLFNAGKNDEGYAVFVELEKEGTRLGQLINQFKMLDGASPATVAKVIDKMLKKAGRDPLTQDQRGRVIGLSQQSIESARALDAAKDGWIKDPTPENAAKADAAMDAANAADLKVQAVVNKFTPKTIPGTLKAILQGNLLTPISEVANLVGNLSFLPFRALDRSIAAGLDVIDSFLRNRPRELAVSPVSGTVEAAKGAARGLAQVPGILLRGAGETVKGEKSTGLQPIKAWVDQFSKNPDLPTVKGSLPFSERIRLALEGTFGIPASVMLRGLQAGDQPFRQAAQARIIANEAKLQGITGERLAMAQKFPELFFKPETLKRIQEETLYAVFQRHSKSLNYISNLIASRGPWVDLAAATVAPYKLTPWNIVSEILSYNPLVAAARTGYEAKQGNSRVAKLNAGKFVVGTMLTAAGYWLYNKGLLAPSMDTPDEQQKARLLAGEVLPPNHINLTGLERALSGGDPAFKPGDKTVDVFRAGGLAGSFFYMTANIGRDMEKQPKGDDAMYGSLLRNSTLEQARFGMNQSFLQGVGGLLQAVKSGETDNYVQSWANTTLSIALPNTLSTLSRATRPAKLEPAGLSGLLKQRLGAFGLDDMLPTKRGLWGEPIPETPDGRNSIIYHFFDITKEKDVTDDPVAIGLYRLWRKTADTSVIPTPPDKSITIGKTTYPLTPEQHSRYAELVGKARRTVVESVFSNPNWSGASDEIKMEVLKRAYSVGAQHAKEQFWQEFNGKLVAKPQRSGFDSR